MGLSECMSATNQLRNLALIGFMGAGKSSVGRMVAQRLRFDFLDTDELIEQRSGKKISVIFAEEGEPAFRRWESKIVEELATLDRTVISTGGGLPAQGNNLASLKTHALVVYLCTTPELLWQRVRYARHRPLLQDPDPQAKIRSLLAARDPFYRQAHVLVSTDHRSLAEVVQQVVMQFNAGESNG